MKPLTAPGSYFAPVVYESAVPANEPPPFDPNDAELSELWKNIVNLQEERTALQTEYNRQLRDLSQKESEAQTTFLHKFGERRIEELQRRRTAKEIDVSKTGLTALNFPEINGSEGCINLARLVTFRVLDVPYKWMGGTPRGGTAQSPLAQTAGLWAAIDEEKAGENAVSVAKEILRNFAGCHQAYRSLIEELPLAGSQRDSIGVYVSLVPFGQEPIPPGVSTLIPRVIHGGAQEITAPQKRIPIDLILVSRKPSADELALAEQHNVEFDVRPIALDALVLIVNRRNPVQSLTIDQILTIYDPIDKPGDIQMMPRHNDLPYDGRRSSLKWSDFGGFQEELGFDYTYIYQCEKERNSGCRELMDDFLEKHRSLILPADKIALRTQPFYTGNLMGVRSMMGPLYALNDNVTGIAYSVFQYEHFIHLNPNLKMVAINGIEPSSETIADGTYPAITEVYVVTKKGIAEDSPAAKLRDFLLSEEGQRLVYESGYVPIKPASN